MSSIAYGIGDWLRRLRENSAQDTLSEQRYQDQGGIGGSLRRFGGSLADSFAAGQAGQPENPASVPPPVVQPVGSDGIPALLRRPEPMPLEAYLAAAEQPAPQVAPEAPSAPVEAPRMNVTVNGREYNYLKGERAPSLFDRSEGPQVASAFGREYAPTGGSFSQMNPIDQSMKSLQQLQDEKAIADAQPAPEGFPGASVAEQRKIEEEIARKTAEQRARVGGELAIEQGKSGIRRNEQGQRRNDYEGAVQAEDEMYAQAIQAIEASPLAPEEKERRKALAATRYEGRKQLVKDSFGFGYGMAGAVSPASPYGSAQ